MATYAFPAELFTVEGDPEAVRESGRAYGQFAAVAGEAAASLGRLDSGGWVGSEGDLFRARVAELPPHLDTAHGAFAQVSRALDDFAESLASAQWQMAAVRDQAQQTLASLAGSRADRAGLQEPTDAEAADVEARIGRLETAWDEQLTVASGIRAQVLEAARHSAAAIRAAGRTSPTADQNWFQNGWEKTRRWTSERLDDLKGFMAEHAGALRGLAKALRVVGVALVAVGAVLAILGVGGAVMTAGFLAWGAGDVLDTAVDWAEGRITGRELLFRAGLAVGLSVLGGGAAKLGAKALERLGPRLRQLAADAGQPGRSLPRTGFPSAAAGGRLPQDMDVVRQVAARAGVGLDGVEVRIRKSAPRPGMFGRTDRNGVLHLYPNAFKNEEELVKTLGHERTHVWQVRTYGYPDEDAMARRMEDGAKATEAQWWDYYQMNQRP
jgi:hypothetical protein